MDDMDWALTAFADLRPGDLYDLLVLRQRVFVVEQTCPFQEADGRDPLARHLLARRDGALIACARLLPATPGKPRSIGRVATAPEARGRGLGREAMRRSIALLLGEDARAPIFLSAQAHLATPFYAPLGFAIIGAPYEEDGIQHVDMLLAPAG